MVYHNRRIPTAKIGGTWDMKVICIIKDDSVLKYLKTYEAEYIDMSDIITDEEDEKYRAIYYIAMNKGPARIIRYKTEVMPLEEWRSKQLDKIIES